MRRERRNRNLVRKIEAAFLSAAVLFFSVFAVHLYRQRRAAEAQIAERELAAAWPETGDKPGDVQDAVVAYDTMFTQDTVEFEGRTFRRNTFVKAVLCIGVDRYGSLEEPTATGFGGQADGIILAVQDTARNSLRLVMIPRDTMTNITLTDLSGNVLGKDIQHLTLAYAYGDGREKSCEYMTEAVSELMGGLKIEHYLAVDINVIAILNDAVGGVTVTVPTDGMEQSDPAFVKGEQVSLDGTQAEAFLRYRDTKKSHSALYRMDQQKEYMEQFFCAVREKSKSDGRIVTKMFDEIQEYMVTDMSKEQYLKMGMDALETEDFGSKDIDTVPGQGISTAKYDEFYPDREGLTRLILDLFYRETD